MPVKLQQKHHIIPKPSRLVLIYRPTSNTNKHLLPNNLNCPTLYLISSYNTPSIPPKIGSSTLLDHVLGPPLPPHQICYRVLINLFLFFFFHRIFLTFKYLVTYLDMISLMTKKLSFISVVSTFISATESFPPSNILSLFLMSRSISLISKRLSFTAAMSVLKSAMILPWSLAIYRENSPYASFLNSLNAPKWIRQV